MRKSSFFFTLMSFLFILLGLAGVHATLAQKFGLTRIQKEAVIVKNFGLTDLCLFTEASYTRHISQADLNTPFQDSPMTLEHFPSGSLVAPPKHVHSSLPSGSVVYGIGGGFPGLLKYARNVCFPPSFSVSSGIGCKTEPNQP